MHESVNQEGHKGLNEDQKVVENDPYTDDLESQEETSLKDRDAFGSEFDDDLFPLTTDSGRAHLSRSQKTCCKMPAPFATERLQQQLDNSSAELRELQGQDPSLEDARTATTEEGCSVTARYFTRNGLLYHHWLQKRIRPKESPEQLVVPKKLRKPILELAHQIPLAGHLGKKKTAKRILQRFYWPTVFCDVKEHCQACTNCQKLSARKVHPAPMIPLPVISEPFQRVAMDIVGPLLKSCSGNRYILVMCDYATRYPEAVPLKGH